MAKKDKGMMTGDPVTYQIPAPAGGVQIETFIPWTLVKRGVNRQVITPIDAPEQFQREAVMERSVRKHAKDSPLIRALGLAHFWQRLLDDGKFKSLTEIAAIECINLSQASRIAQLARLAPEVIEACLTGLHPTISLDHLNRSPIHSGWRQQCDHLRRTPIRKIS